MLSSHIAYLFHPNKKTDICTPPSGRNPAQPKGCFVQVSCCSSISHCRILSDVAAKTGGW